MTTSRPARSTAWLLSTLLVAALATPAWSTTPGVNGELFFTRDLDGNGGSAPAILAAAPDGTERTVAEEGDSGFTPQVSPDGSQVIYRTPGNAIMRRPVAGGDATEVIPAGGADGFASWSPDGSQIVLFATGMGLSVVNADGSGLRPLDPATTAGFHDVVWSTDGFLYQAEGDRIVRIDPGSGAATEIAAPDLQILEDFRLDSSPDGTRLLVSCRQLSDPTMTPSVCIVGTDGVLQQRISVDDRFQRDPLFSPDGTRIGFSMTRPDFSDDDYFTTDLAGGDLRQVITDGVATSWSPVAGIPEPPAPPAPAPDCIAADGDPSTTERIAETEPVRVAVALSCGLWSDAGGGGAADHVVLSRDDAFADSLGGAALTANGPMLFSGSQSLDPLTRTEIQRLLAPGGTVYLLGGEAALSAAIEAEITALGFTPNRLSGPSRVETALAVADEVARLNPADFVMIARAFNAPGNETSGWADSVTGGAFAAATNQPIIITPSESLHPAVEAWLADRDGLSVILLGGEAALSPAVADAVGPHDRISGPDRFATNAAIVAELGEFEGVPQTEGPRAYTIVNGEDPLGWAHGLAAASRAQRQGAPVLLTGNGSTVRDPLIPLVATCGDPEVDILLIGTEEVIDPSIISALDELDGNDCPA